MKLNNIWGYGQLFGFSGIDGVNRWANDFVGTLTEEKIGIRFELKEWIKVVFPIKGEIKFRAITGDMIDAETEEGDFFLTFATADALVGYSPVLPEFIGQKGIESGKTWGTDVWHTMFDWMALQYRKEGNLYKFCVYHSSTYVLARSGANDYIHEDVLALKKARYDYFKNMPPCKNKKYEQLYYKALSVNKVNVHTPEGNIPCMWTTPDRVPHRNLWLWDSVFHALAMVDYNPALAKDAIRAVLTQIRRDGFMPCTMTPIAHDDLTQPQVLAWGVWEVYQKTGDESFLRESVDSLERYLEWDIQNRDKNGNELLEWFTEPDYTECKCGESGLDNSPRFDFAEDMDCMDFSMFLAHDALYLSYIYDKLGDKAKRDKWKDKYERVKSKMNELLWDEETGVYYDRLFNGELSKVLTPTSFFPMFANIPSKEQAEKMVKTLTNPDLLWTEYPLATVAKNHPTYSTDMWRGGVWLNLNYFVIEGLKNYGYYELAETLKTKTLDMVDKWYKKTGAIFEFFAPEGEVVPYECERKGKPTTPPDWRKHVHSIIDFNWSACFTLLFIQDESAEHSDKNV